MNHHAVTLFLASRSPRRSELLESAGYRFDVFPAADSAEDARREGETPRNYVMRLAQQKAAYVAAAVEQIYHFGDNEEEPREESLPHSCPCCNCSHQHEDDEEPFPIEIPRLHRALVLGCDTIVLCRNEILGKPQSREDAERMLRLLGGSEHQVLSGLCLHSLPEQRVYLQRDETTLTMRELSEQELQDYLDGELWVGKAGAFGYQDRHDWISITQGSESNVVGLPLELLEKMYENAIAEADS